MTQEERRAKFERKAEIGKRRNDACNKCVDELFSRWWYKEEMNLDTLVHLAWAEGCNYGKEHAEELKVFDK